MEPTGYYRPYRIGSDAYHMNRYHMVHSMFSLRIRWLKLVKASFINNPSRRSAKSWMKQNRLIRRSGEDTDYGYSDMFF